MYLLMIKDLFRFFSMVGSILLGFCLLWAVLFGISQQNLSSPKHAQRLEDVVDLSPFEIVSNKKASVRGLRIQWDGSQWIHTHDRSPIKASEKPLPSFQKATLFIYLEGSPEGVSLKELKELFKPYSEKEDLIFLCASDSTLKELRSLSPKWSYGTGQTFLSRLYFFSSMKLLGLLTIPGDVIHIQDIRTISQSEASNLINYATKHNKLVVFEPKNIAFAKAKYSALFTAP